jgi:quinol-cytochrome oxidoreductase complex cytochrome b subunit
MKAIEILLSVFLTMAMGAMAGSIAQLLTKDFSLASWLFVFFFIPLRIKFFLDDLDYCRYKAKRDSKLFKFEFTVGMVACFLWILSAVLLPNHFWAACLTLAIAFILATYLVTISKIEDPKRSFWFNTNIYYIFFLILSSIFSFVSGYLTSISMLFAILMVIRDFWCYAPFRIFEEKD